jgi:hypothetical protein
MTPLAQQGNPSPGGSNASDWNSWSACDSHADLKTSYLQLFLEAARRDTSQVLQRIRNQVFSPHFQREIRIDAQLTLEALGKRKNDIFFLTTIPSNEIYSNV